MAEMSNDPNSAPAAEKAGIIDDLIEIWTSPSAVFKRRANAGFGMMMLIMTIVIGLLFFANRGVMQGIMDAQFDKAIAEASSNGQPMPPEAVAAMRKWGGIAGSVGAFIGVPIGILVLGLFVWLTGKIVGADDEFGYGKATMISAYSFAPKVLAFIAVTVQGLLMDTSTLTGPYQLSASVARFMDPNGNAGMLAMLARLDVFTIWCTAIIAIGIVVVGKAPKSKLLPAAVIIFLIGSIPAFWQVLMGAMKG